MNFLANFFALYNRLDRNDVFFAAMDGLLKHREELQDMTIYDMAEVCLVSRTTINRLTKLLGYGSFKEFKYEMCRSFSKSGIHNHLIPMSRYGRPEETPELILNAMEAGVAQLRSGLSLESLQAAAELLRRSRRVRFYLEELPGALTLQTNLALDGKEATFCTAYAQQLEDAAALTPEHALILLKDERPDSLSATPLLQQAVRQGAAVLLLGNSVGSGAADVCLNCFFGGGSIARYGVSIALDVLATVYRQTYMMDD